MDKEAAGPALVEGCIILNWKYIEQIKPLCGLMARYAQGLWIHGLVASGKVSSFSAGIIIVVVVVVAVVDDDDACVGCDDKRIFVQFTGWGMIRPVSWRGDR
nr:hypothetical protein Iba_chr12cCG2620 [Ipomoea batatas]